jgi:SAM-dependent methyltransferase
VQHAPFTALARVYDAIMADIEYGAWADFILSYAGDTGLEARTALDLACGTGGLTRELRSAGLSVTGLDGSAEMLRVAAERLPGVSFVQGDLRDFTLTSGPATFDLVTCVFDSYNNLIDDGDLGRALSRAHAALNPGGLLAFDVNTRTGVRELWEGDSIEGVEPLPGDAEVHYQWSHSFDEARDLGVVQAFCRLIPGEDSDPSELAEEFVELHHERGYDPAELDGLLREAGFASWEILEYPDYAPPPPDSSRVWVFARRDEEPS